MAKKLNIEDQTLSKKESYMGNPQLPSKNAKFLYTPEMVEEIEKCKNDIVYFAKNYFYIIEPDMGKILIPLLNYQIRLLKAFQDHRYNIVTSSRQSGKTTVLTILALHETCFKDFRNTVIVANKEDTAKMIFKRVKLAYQELPNWLKPGLKSWGQESTEFSNGSTIGISTTSGSAARGSTIQCVDGGSVVKIRNKKTGIVENISLRTLHNNMNNNNVLNTILSE
jgi:hypothetical protein